MSQVRWKYRIELGRSVNPVGGGEAEAALVTREQL